MAHRMLAFGKIFRDKAARRLRGLIPDDRQDALDMLIADPLADLIRAAEAEGYSRQEIAAAVNSGAFNGWYEARADAIGDEEAETEGIRFARFVGDPRREAGA